MHIPSIHKRLALIEPRHVLIISQQFNVYDEWEDGKKVGRYKLRNREDAFVLKLTSAGIHTTVVLANEFPCQGSRREAAGTPSTPSSSLARSPRALSVQRKGTWLAPNPQASFCLRVLT